MSPKWTFASATSRRPGMVSRRWNGAAHGNPVSDGRIDESRQQQVAEVKAPHDTLGDDLLSVELGNEFDNVTTLTGGQYYE